MRSEIRNGPGRGPEREFRNEPGKGPGTVRKIHHALDRALDLLYPRRCPGCGDILPSPGLLICPRCEKEIRPIPSPVCLKCGAPVREEEEYCRECRAHAHMFTQGRAVFIYDDRWKKSLEQYKYYGCREYADFYAAAMVRWCGGAMRRWRIDLIVPVPLHPRKERSRGFNQAWLIAERVGRRTGIPASAELLKKTGETGDQKKLDPARRRRNLKDAFTAESAVRGRRILVIDDVYTTGSTMDACASCLLEAGAESVYSLVFCIGVR